MCFGKVSQLSHFSIFLEFIQDNNIGPLVCKHKTSPNCVYAKEAPWLSVKERYGASRQEHKFGRATQAKLGRGCNHHASLKQQSSVDVNEKDLM